MPDESQTPDVVEMVDPRSGQVHAVAGGEEEVTKLKQGWVYKDPNVQRPVGLFDPQTDESHVDLVPATNVREYMKRAEQAGQQAAPLPRRAAVDEIFARGDEVKKEQLKDMGFLTGVTTVADDISFGAGPALREALAPEINDVIQDSQEANPDVTLGAHLGAMVLPALIPGGQASAAGRAGILAKLGGQATRGLRSAGPVGLSVQLGAKTEQAVQGLLRKMAAGDGLLARSAPAVAREITEGTTASLGAGFTLAQMSDHELTAEEFLGDAAFGAALGLGFRGVAAGAGGLNKLRKRMRQSGGSRLFNEARITAADDAKALEDVSVREVMEDAARGEVPEGVGSKVYRKALMKYANAASVPAGTRSSLLRQTVQPEVRRAFRDADVTLPQISRDLEKGLDSLIDMRRGFSDSAFSALQKRADDILESNPGGEASILARNQTGDILQSMKTVLDDAVDNPAAFSQGMGQVKALRQAVSDQLDRVKGRPREVESDVLDAEGNPVMRMEPTEPLPSQRELFEQSRDLSRNIRQLWKDNPKGNTGILANNLVQKTRHSLVRNEDAFGEMARLQARLDDAEGQIRNIESGVLRKLGSQDFEGRLPDARRIRQEIARLANAETGETKLDSIREALDDFVLHARRADEATAGGLAGEREAVENLVDTMKKSVDRGIDNARAEAVTRAALREENQVSGFMQQAGMGSLVGAAVAPTLGADSSTGIFIGALGGAAMSSLIRPGGFIQRLTNAEDVLNTFRGRLSNGKNKLVRFLKGSTQKLGRPGPAAGVIQAIEGSDRERLEEYKRVRTDIRELVQDPHALQNRLATSTAGIEHDHPRIAEQVQTKSVVGLNYLAANLPVEATDPLTGEPPLPPSMSEVDSFMRRYRALEDPLSLLDDAAANRLHPHSVEAVRTVYPRIYQEISVVTQEAIEEAGPDTTYAARVQLGNLMGFEAHPTLKPSFLAAMASPAAQTPQQDQAQRGPESRGTQRTLDVADSTKTETQSVEENL